MFPYFIVYPLLLIVACLYPLAKTIQALRKKDEAEYKVWLMYWSGYMVMSILFSLPLVETILSLPFTIIESVLFDIYYEAQLLIAYVILSPHNPEKRQLDMICNMAEMYAEKHGNQIEEVLKKQYDTYSPMIIDLYNQTMKKVTPPAETKAK